VLLFSIYLTMLLSGNLAGDVGARALSKSLALNRKLTVVHLDRNNVSPQGFSYIAASLQRYVIHVYSVYTPFDKLV
jgi:hypothetical protein